MSYFKTNYRIDNRAFTAAQKPRLCAKCEELRPPESGVEMRPGRWVCGACFAARTRPVGRPGASGAPSMAKGSK